MPYGTLSSMPHSQGRSNNSYIEPKKSNISVCICNPIYFYCCTCINCDTPEFIVHCFSWVNKFPANTGLSASFVNINKYHDLQRGSQLE